MDQAGCRPYDIVVDDVSFTEFWQRLEEARGGAPIPITVASWTDIGPVSKRSTRQISVRVPRKDYSIELENELGFRCEVRYFKQGGLGFHCDVRYFKKGPYLTGVVIVTKLRRNGLMERAGFRDRDILLNIGAVPDLFARLEQARGGVPVTLDVVPWLDPSD